MTNYSKIRRSRLISRDNITAKRTRFLRSMSHNSPVFQLNYENAQKIKSNYKPIMQIYKVLSYRMADPNNNIEISKEIIFERCLSSSLIQRIMTIYKFTPQRIHELLRNFCYLGKLSKYIQTHKMPKRIQLLPYFSDQHLTKLLMESVYITEEEFSNYIKKVDYANLSVNLWVIKYWIEKLRTIKIAKFIALMNAIEIEFNTEAKVTFEDFSKIHYFMIDRTATQKQYIKLGERFLSVVFNKSENINDASNILKNLLINGNDLERGKVLIKALLTNFILCKIIDKKGNFNRIEYINTYTKRRMNIDNFIIILLN